MIGTHRNSWIKIFFICILLVGLPIFVWAVLTQRIELRKKAATSEPTQICWNRVIFREIAVWPDSCKGSPRTDLTCTKIQVPLTQDEQNGYKAWMQMGGPYIPGCNMPTPSCTPIPPCYYYAGTSEQPRCPLLSSINYCPPTTPTPTQRCTSNKDCPAGYICSATPPGGCPVIIVNGVEQRSACARVPQCWPISPTPTPTPAPNCTPYPRCYYPLTPDQPRCTLLGNVNYCPPMTMFTLSASGAVPELLPNQVMPLTINVREFDGSAGTPAEGFNVQVAVNVLPLSGNTPSVFSQNAVFNPKTQLWELPVPRPQNVGTYRLQVHAYCAQDNSLCAIRYGQSRQLEWEYHFRAVIAQPQNLTFKVRLAGVNGVEAKGATINVKLKLKDGTVLPLDKPLVLNPVGTNGVYEATATLTNPLPSGTTLRVLVKGEKHSQVVFCHPSGQTEPCNDTDYITPSSYSFDFTGRPLPPGDLNQDGTINNTDLTLLTDTFKKPSSQVSADDLKHADVNYDGYVDNFDLGFILQSLSTRYDE